MVLLQIADELAVPGTCVPVAPETSPTAGVPLNGPLLLPSVSVLKFHVAKVTGLAHEDGGAGLLLTTNVSEPVLPVSMVELINRLFVVLIYVPSVEAVTVMAMVQVP